MLKRYRLPAPSLCAGILWYIIRKKGGWFRAMFVYCFDLSFYSAYDTPFEFECAVIRGCFLHERENSAGDSASTPSPGTACCGRGGTGDNAAALSLGNDCSIFPPHGTGATRDEPAFGNA
ncbi:hypothetical protein PG996_007285 [Apiospora saccharicola]|uniref:Secreted protein n=1 Tax=Apiospora saccharicola TaxID=335842 RepID=A0ABR1VAE4_9PEZI